VIDTFIFDLSEVCVNGLMGFEKVLYEETGINAFLIDQYLHDSKLADAFIGNITERQYFKKLKNDLNDLMGDLSSKIKMPDFEELIRKNFTEVPGTRQIVESLKNQNYKLAILSDHVHEWADYIEANHPFLGLFDQKIYSFQSGYTKDSPAAFEYALRKLEADPEKVLFIDDQSKNLGIAGSAGIKQLHHFYNAEGLRNELKVKYGIDVNHS
jgi:HAD superfamily hydrolase (TIGR01509 family)